MNRSVFCPLVVSALLAGGTTIHMMPAVQIMHSKDLANWELAGYCTERLDFGPAFRLEGGSIDGQGIWAPCAVHPLSQAVL